MRDCIYIQFVIHYHPDSGFGLNVDILRNTFNAKQTELARKTIDFIDKAAPQAVIFPVDTRTLSAGNIEISQEIQTKEGTRRLNT